jgi:hypothetical protein
VHLPHVCLNTLGVIVILLDTGVVVVTILSSIETLRIWQKGEIWGEKSLVSLLIYEGEYTLYRLYM